MIRRFTMVSHAAHPVFKTDGKFAAGVEARHGEFMSSLQ